MTVVADPASGHFPAHNNFLRCKVDQEDFSPAPNQAEMADVHIERKPGGSDRNVFGDNLEGCALLLLTKKNTARNIFRLHHMTPIPAQGS